MLKNPDIRIFYNIAMTANAAKREQFPLRFFSALLFDKGNVLRNQIIAAMQLAILPFKGM